MENAVTGDRDIVMPFLCYYDAPKNTGMHKSIIVRTQ